MLGSSYFNFYFLKYTPTLKLLGLDLFSLLDRDLGFTVASAINAATFEVSLTPTSQHKHFQLLAPSKSSDGSHRFL